MKASEAKIRTHSDLMIPQTQSKDRRVSAYTEESRGEFLYIPLGQLVAFHNQARKNFDDEKLQLLAESIKSHGIRQPLTVLPIDDGKYEIVSGERRFRAAKMAGKKNVPCIILHDPSIADEAAIIENIHRQDLHPVELGNAYSRLLLSEHYTVGKLAQRLGAARSQISEVSTYGNLPEKIKDILISQNIDNRDFIRSLTKCSTSEAMESKIQERLSVVSSPKNRLSPLLSKDKVSIMRVHLSEAGISINKNGLKNLPHSYVKNLILELDEVVVHLNNKLKMFAAANSTQEDEMY